MTITIYHNPACGTSRNVLAMIRNSGEEPRVIEYLKTPPSPAELVDVIAKMGSRHANHCAAGARLTMKLGIDDPKFSDYELVDLMIETPILINRPIVVPPLGVKLCRPSECIARLARRLQRARRQPQLDHYQCGLWKVVCLNPAGAVSSSRNRAST
jgi:arsenate reductase